MLQKEMTTHKWHKMGDQLADSVACWRPEDFLISQFPVQSKAAKPKEFYLTMFRIESLKLEFLVSRNVPCAILYLD